MTLGQQTTLSLQIRTHLYYLHTRVVTRVEETTPKLKSNMKHAYDQHGYDHLPYDQLNIKNRLVGFVQVGMTRFIRGAKRANPRNNWIFLVPLEGLWHGR